MSETSPHPACPAQPTLTPREVFLQMVRDSEAQLHQLAEDLVTQRYRREAARIQMRRRLAGVVADCETVRLALEKGRMR